jgi:acetoin utilization deacetylase AcuC-like enzyme
MDDLVFFYPEGHEAHAEWGHPERPERVEAIRQALKEAGWWEMYRCVEPLALPQEVLRAIHTPEYLAYLETACQRCQRLDLDTYTNAESWQLALNSAGGAAAVAREVWQGKARRGFALARPPGHHALPGRGMGFCLLNNIALAAEALLQGEGAQRLAIVDLDLHHGNGTQEVFYRRVEVFYLSTHQAPFYPGTGRLEERGAGLGFGTNANLPLPPGSGDLAFRAALDEVFLPLLDRYEPEMLLVSAGFDTHWKDPIGSLALTAKEYGRLVSRLARWADEHCGGRIALVLEGGYHLEAGAACAQAATAALLGQPWMDPLGSPPRREGLDWQPVIRRAKQIWGLEERGKQG